MAIGRFAENIQRGAPSLKPILNELYRLYALASIEKDLSWFLCHKILTTAQGTHCTPSRVVSCLALTLTCSNLPPASAVGDAVRALCASLAPQALHLVDAFGIPDHMVQAPIALDWHKFNLVDNQGECVDYLKEEFNL